MSDVMIMNQKKFKTFQRDQIIWSFVRVEHNVLEKEMQHVDLANQFTLQRKENHACKPPIVTLVWHVVKENALCECLVPVTLRALEKVVTALRHRMKDVCVLMVRKDLARELQMQIVDFNRLHVIGQIVGKNSDVIGKEIYLLQCSLKCSKEKPVWEVTVDIFLEQLFAVVMQDLMELHIQQHHLDHYLAQAILH